MPTAFSDFYSPLRVILGDLDPYGVFQYQDATLDGAVRTVFLLGRNPDGYLLSGDDRNTASEIDPEIPVGDPFARITYEAALLLVGGSEGAYSYRTRALSRSSSGEAKRDLLVELRLKIYEIVAGNEQFASVQSFVTWLQSYNSIQEAALNQITPPVLPTLPLQQLYL